MEEQHVRSDLGRALAALRRLVRQNCSVCKRTYEGAAHKRYCSAACRQRAYRERKDGTTKGHAR